MLPAAYATSGAFSEPVVRAYRTLGFTTTQQMQAASLEDIKGAFRREAMRYHPDFAKTEAEKKRNNDKIREVIDAYQLLRKMKEKN